jgi:hypothetical protein
MRTVKAKGDGHFCTVIRRGSPNALLPILTLTGAGIRGPDVWSRHYRDDLRLLRSHQLTVDILSGIVDPQARACA